jgi:hypothetical protein
MNKQDILKSLIREEVRKELMKESKIVDLIIRLFFKGKIKNAVADLKNDPDIKEKFRAIEYALQDLKDATERKEEHSKSEEYNNVFKSYGVKRIKY